MSSALDVSEMNATKLVSLVLLDALTPIVTAYLARTTEDIIQKGTEVMKSIEDIKQPNKITGSDGKFTVYRPSRWQYPEIAINLAWYRLIIKFNCDVDERGYYLIVLKFDNGCDEDEDDSKIGYRMVRFKFRYNTPTPVYSDEYNTEEPIFYKSIDELSESICRLDYLIGDRLTARERNLTMLDDSIVKGSRMVEPGSTFAEIYEAIHDARTSLDIHETYCGSHIWWLPQ